MKEETRAAIDLILGLKLGQKCYVCSSQNKEHEPMIYENWDDSEVNVQLIFREPLPKVGDGIKSYLLHETGVGLTQKQAIENFGIISNYSFRKVVPEVIHSQSKIIKKAQ